MSDYFVEPFVDTGLGNSAYILSSHETKKGVLIGPLHDADRCLASANQHWIQFTHVLDTHLHADFVSGSRELAAHTGAQIGASAEAKLGFEYRPLTENDVLDFGAFQLRVTSTPGHTPEHISFLVVDADGKTPSAIFSGGALIVGGAARTDLLAPDSMAAISVLRRRGYRNVILVDGGFNKWRKNGFEVVTDQQL